MKRPSIKRRRVDNPRNSTCGSARLTDLDWSNWWMDGRWDAGQGRAGLYLHVAHLGHDGAEGTSHRVWCRMSDTPRLQMRDGVLYWLIDPETTEASNGD